MNNSKIRTFDTGATRNADENKLDYEGFICPNVLERYAQYMQSHRKQSDGSIRDSDNWQKGIPQDQYLKSLVRHTLDFWRLQRLEDTHIENPEGEMVDGQSLICSIMFNAMGWLHEELKKDE